MIYIFEAVIVLCKQAAYSFVYNQSSIYWTTLLLHVTHVIKNWTMTTNPPRKRKAGPRRVPNDSMTVLRV